VRSYYGLINHLRVCERMKYRNEIHYEVRRRINFKNIRCYLFKDCFSSRQISIILKVMVYARINQKVKGLFRKSHLL
jgi:hypothetical protein